MRKLFIFALSIPLFFFLMSILFKFRLFTYTIKFIDTNILGIIGLLFILYIIPAYSLNEVTKNKYKREKNNNDLRYVSKRCFEDGDAEEKELSKNGRDFFYLVEDKNKKFYRVVNPYTLDQLGYQRPSRKNDECFHKSDGYSLGEEIRLYNVISDIKDILSLKEKTP